MRHFVTRRLVIFTGILVAVQYLLTSFSFPARSRLDLLYLLILDYAFSWSWERVPLFAFTLGLLRDFLGGHLFGIETLSLTATGFLLYGGVQKLERENFWVRFGIGFLFVGITETLSVSLGEALEVSRGLSFDAIGGILGTTFYTGIFAPVFFWLTGRWFHRTPALKQYELF